MALSREFVAENSEKTLETPLDKQGSFREDRVAPGGFPPGAPTDPNVRN